MTIGHLGHHEDAAGLRHCLNDQDTRHDGVAGKMTLEKWLIDGDILDRNKALGRLKFDDPVDEQKRVTVGKKFQDLLDVERHSRAPDGAQSARLRS